MISAATANVSFDVADHSSFESFIHGLVDSSSLAVRSGADEAATVVARLLADSSEVVTFHKTQPELVSGMQPSGFHARRIRAANVEGWDDDRFIRPLPRVTPPEISCEPDPALLEAGMQAIQGLPDFKLLPSWWFG